MSRAGTETEITAQAEARQRGRKRKKQVQAAETRHAKTRTQRGTETGRPAKGGRAGGSPTIQATETEATGKGATAGDETAEGPQGRPTRMKQKR